MIRRLFLLAALVLSVGLGAPARAQDSAMVSVRLGNSVPWLGPSSGAATSNNARMLGLAGSPLTGVLPGWLRWALEPEVQVQSAPGAAYGLSGQSYHGLSWSVPLASGLLHQSDALSFGFSIGQTLTDLTSADNRDRHNALPSPLLRLGAGIGYQVTPRLGLYVLFDHQSSNGATRVEDVENDLGIRVGLHF